MRGIKHVLTERQYAWEDAVKLAEEDPEIDMSGEGPLFTPSDYMEAPYEERSTQAEAKDATLRRLAADAMAAKEADATAALPTSDAEPPSGQKEQDQSPRI